MQPIPANFETVKVSDQEYDVLIFSSINTLKAFKEIYPKTILIEKSKFAEKPVIVVPSFESNFHAKVFINYWEKALAAPEKSCQTCPTVQQFFQFIENAEKGTEPPANTE